MYVIASKEDVVRVPPNLLGEDFHKLAERLTQESFQNKVEGDGSYTVLVRNIEPQGDGRIIHGDGAIYQKVQFETLMFRPTLHEIVEGTVCEVMKFGAFVRFGPLDGLLHISQIMDDRIDVDVDGRRLLGKDTKRELRIGDSVRARIVSLSINERNPRESKIGLTMRQPGLGKIEWIQEERMKKEDKK
ncbi:MAG: DNA-directed RNA polymerase [Candidatus Thermoplasmatota archaeon]|nr:DNA-directed RNA polymerase [Candidatus Thermoplasmatota archaeon]